MAELLSVSELVTLFTPLNWNKMFDQTSGPTNIDLPNGFAIEVVEL